MTGAALRIVCPRTGKQVFGTRERADLFARRVESQTGMVYRPYTCEFCGWFHLTSRPKRHR